MTTIYGKDIDLRKLKYKKFSPADIPEVTILMYEVLGRDVMLGYMRYALNGTSLWVHNQFCEKLVGRRPAIHEGSTTKLHFEMARPNDPNLGITEFVCSDTVTTEYYFDKDSRILVFRYDFGDSIGHYEIFYVIRR